MASSAKIRLVVLFGGRSAEHEISLQSARAVLDHLDPSRYRVVPVGITKDGGWLDPENSTRLLEGGQPIAPGGTPFLPEGTDCVFPVLHGPYGEDGRIQGWLEIQGVAYVGARHTGSAVAMDKSLSKRILRDARLPVLSWTEVEAREFELDPAGVVSRVAGERGFAAFVKPACLGSSVGISRVENEAELRDGLEEAFRHGHIAIVEPAVDAREFELAVLGGDPPIASLPGEIRTEHWYDYQSKYLDDTAELLVPAPDLQDAMIQHLQSLALQACRLLRVDGMARVDFFLGRKTGRPVLNEVNTIPGFTAISLYPRLMEHSGIPFRQLCDRLIDHAMETARRNSLQEAPQA